MITEQEYYKKYWAAIKALEQLRDIYREPIERLSHDPEDIEHSIAWLDKTIDILYTAWSEAL